MSEPAFDHDPHDLPISAARDQLSEVVNAAAYGGEITYVTRRGRRLAAIVPASLIDAIRAQEDAEDVREADAAMAEPGESIPWETVKAEPSRRMAEKVSRCDGGR